MTRLDRDAMLDRARDSTTRWDLLVIGGGATGAACALDSAARGYQTLLLERHDFANSTSSRSTKLVHGGVRYLRQANFPLVSEALVERATLLRNAPHVVHDLQLIIPAYRWWEKPYYNCGLAIYDILATGGGFPRCRGLSRSQTLRRLPNIESAGLKGGVLFHDGQFDDARLLIDMLRTAARLGGTLLNYCRVESFSRDAAGRLVGVVARDLESDESFPVFTRAVVNATGIFFDQIRQLDCPQAARRVRPSQGAHLTLDRAFLPGEAALMIPQTLDGRVLFLIPWQGKLVVGTTDNPVGSISPDPRPLPGEIDFILNTASRYLVRAPTRSDIRSCWAGLRPLVDTGAASTASLARDHHVEVSRSGLVSVTGGKWTTCRAMAEQVVDQAARVGGLRRRACPTRDLPIDASPAFDPASLTEPFGDGAFSHAVRFAVRETMARTLEDVLSRRLRLLPLDAGLAWQVAPQVATHMASLLGRDLAWVRNQLRSFERSVAAHRPIDQSTSSAASADPA